MIVALKYIQTKHHLRASVHSYQVT